MSLALNDKDVGANSSPTLSSRDFHNCWMVVVVVWPEWSQKKLFKIIEDGKYIIACDFAS